MTLKVVIAGTFFLFLLSLSCLGFFLFFVDPEFLSFSGFIFFYASAFGWLFSMFFLAGYFAGGKRSRAFVGALPRRAALLALLAILSLLFEHLSIFSAYVFVALIVSLGCAEYYFLRR